MSLRAVAQELAIADKTVDRAIAYSHAVEEMPELKGKAVTWVIHEHQRRIDREERGKKLVGMPIPQNLIHGDALEELKKLPNESIDCIITDPPWGVGYSPHALEEVRNDNMSIFDYMPKITQEFYRILKKDADCYTFCGYGESFCSFYHAFINAHFMHSNTLIWIKDSRVKGLDFSHRYAHFYEPIIYMKKGNRFLNNSFSKDVLNFAKVEGGYASTEKPIELLSYLINNSTVKGEIVLDCFCGSGSTLVAAQQNERRWIGIDIEQKWIDISKQRIMELRKNEV